MSCSLIILILYLIKIHKIKSLANQIMLKAVEKGKHISDEQEEKIIISIIDKCENITANATSYLFKKVSEKEILSTKQYNFLNND